MGSHAEGHAYLSAHVPHKLDEVLGSLPDAVAVSVNLLPELDRIFSSLNSGLVGMPDFLLSSIFWHDLKNFFCFFKCFLQF